MAVVGVIPAAGFGTRLSLQGLSKEMVVVDGRPVMDYCVDRMQSVHPDSVRLVTRAAKTDVIANANGLGLEVILAETRSAAHSIAIGVNGLEPDDIVLIGFPDTIWEPAAGFQRLAESVSDGSDIALGLFHSSEPERCDVVILDAGHRVTGVLVKPPVAPSNQIWGCAAARRHALSGIEDFDQPGQFIDTKCNELTVTGVWLSDRFVDIGTPEQWLRRSTPAHPH
jgi:glucose-1-phosphate thymidylyltransferase